ncbi:MAG TPA: S53 family peptidase [Isosphaeraceae bacterium]|jgi:kumamolisin|nr:S53 family peptidase [Isosphaeraceae bacterium]
MSAPDGNSLKPIPGSELAPRRGSRVVGEVNPEERIRLTLRLRSRAPLHGQGSLEEFILKLGAQKPGERSYLTRKKFADQFGADENDVKQVLAYAKENHAEIVESNLAERKVEVMGTIADLSRAFAVTMQLSNHQGITFRERVSPISLPNRLEGVVEGVFGFDNRRMAEPQYRIRSKHNTTALAADAGLSPLQVAKTYNFPTGVTGSGQCIGILEFGGGFDTGDLSAYFSQLGVNPAPAVIAVGVGGASNNPGADPQADSEVMLDIEMAGAVAPGAKLVVYFSGFTVKGWVDALTRAVHDDVNHPSILSISWGFAEREPFGGKVIWTPAAVAAVNQALMAAAAMGVTVTCAAGDDGSADQFDDGLAHVDFPASSPFILSCGGTKLMGATETVWNEEAIGDGATGGGISELNDRPAYQLSPPVPLSANPDQHRGRGVPDVAGNADPVTGFMVRVNGAMTTIGGTSAVAPLWAGLVALINESLSKNDGKNLGFFNPLLYSQLGPSGVLRDITEGNNGAYEARTGWDACTGWGSPDGKTLLAALK